MTNVLHVHSFFQHFIDNPVQIGGQGIEVEIDKSKFGRRKYNRGRWQEGHWVFGGIERVTGNSFLVEVKKRDAATLVLLIQQCIRPGSVIFSDEWRAYSSLQSLGYTHHTVNHSQNFVDPNTGAHTQTVEKMLGGVKAIMRKQRSMNSLSCLKPPLVPRCRNVCKPIRLQNFEMSLVLPTLSL